MKKYLVFFSFFFLLNTIFGQQTHEKQKSLFNDYFYKGFKFHDNRKLDSCRYVLRKLDSIVKLSPSDSSQYFQKELLEAALFVRESKTGDAIGKLLKAQRYFKNNRDSINIGLVLYNLGVANYYVNRRLVAGDYFKEALTYRNHTTKRLQTRIYQNFGSIYLEEGMLKKDTALIRKSVTNYKEAIKIYKKESWLLELSLSTSLLAESYNQLGDFSLALLTIEKAIPIAKKSESDSQLGFSLIKKTTFLGRLNRYKEALNTIEEAIPVFKKLEDKLTLLYAYNEKKKILVGLKRFEEASILSDTIYQTSIVAYDTRFTDKVAEMDAKYKTAEKEKEIAVQKEELLANELAIKNKNLFALLLGATLLIVAILAVGYYHRSQYKRKQLQKEIDLKDALATIKTQNKLQEQRLRISRDLHDNIGAQLSFIISSIDNLKRFSVKKEKIFVEKLSNISSFTSETIFQLRDTIWAMNKSEILAEDLHTRLLSFVEKAKTAVPETTIEVNNALKNTTKFTSIIGMNLFRVTQEAINNAIKYSKASKIEIELKETTKKYSISIIDNGVGFDITKVSLGNGLTNIESRMSQINGKAVIKSNINKGTQITVSVSK